MVSPADPSVKSTSSSDTSLSVSSLLGESSDVASAELSVESSLRVSEPSCVDSSAVCVSETCVSSTWSASALVVESASRLVPAAEPAYSDTISEVNKPARADEYKHSTARRVHR